MGTIIIRKAVLQKRLTNVIATAKVRNKLENRGSFSILILDGSALSGNELAGAKRLTTVDTA
jgi:hypothetical protein